MKPYSKNPREISTKSYEKLEDTLARLGDLGGIVHNLETDEIVGGNQRMAVFTDYEVVIEQKFDKPDEQGTVGLGYIIWRGHRFAYRQVRWDERTAEEANIVANVSGGTWDWTILANEWNPQDLIAYGLDEQALKDWKRDVSGVDALIKSERQEHAEDIEPQIDRADELQEIWQVAFGQLWSMGNHKIICGDCTDPATLKRLMGEEKAAICWTDPPWNLAYGESIKNNDNGLGWKKRTIQNDNLGDKFGEFAHKFCRAIYDNLVPGGILYMAMSPQEWGLIMQQLEEVDKVDNKSIGFHWSSTIIWAKDSLVVSRKDYHTQYEPVWYGWKSDAARVCKVEDRKQSDLWNIPRPKRSDEHPTMKPVELVARSLRNSSQPGDIVIDFFGGSGTTMAAAEGCDRRSRLAELDPKYVAVTLQRWVDITGGKPELQVEIE